MAKGFLGKLRTSFSGLKGDNILYFPGCMTRHHLKDVFDAYKAVLSDLGIDYRMINDITCCGSPLLNAGYKTDFTELKEKNLKILNANGITKIITNCPHCYDVFKNNYNLKGIKVEHIAQTLDIHKQKITSENEGEVTYHDPCLLSRKNGIVNEPREILRRTGFKLSEPSKTKENTFCCGAGGGVKQNSPKIANKIAKKRLEQLPCQRIIVSCPYCYAHLKENAGTTKKIMELSRVVAED